MAYMKFYMGKESDALKHLDGIYLTSDTHKIFYNGEAYNKNSDYALNQDLSDFKNEVSNNYLRLSGGTITGDVTLNYGNAVLYVRNSLDANTFVYIRNSGITIYQSEGTKTTSLSKNGITISGKTTSDLLNAGGSTTSISDLVTQITASIVDNAPTTLDTLNELAAALGDDPNFATTIANQLANKADKDHTHNYLPTTGGTINGNLTVTGTNGGTVSAKSFSSAVAANIYNPSDMNINRPYEIMGDTVINVTMAGNDKFTIAASGTSDNGFVSLYTADNGNEPIYAAQVNTGTGLITHYITLMDASGNQKFNNINAKKIAITDKTSTDLLAGDGSTVSLIKDFTKYPYISEATTCEEAIKILAQKLNEFHQLQVTYKINPTPSDAQVTINGSVRNSITVNFGTEITWSVQKSGYATQSGSDTAYHDITKQVTLHTASVTLTINPTPSDATVKLEGFITNSITVDYGTNVQWEVSKSGYQTQSGTYQVLENHTMNVSLVEELPDPVIPSSLPSGVSIVDSVGRTFTNAEDWDESFGLTGIGINSGGHQFIFALANEPMSYTGADDKSISTPKVWSTALYQVDVPNLENITSEATVLQNFASKANTDAIMAALATSKNPSESNNAAWVARNYSAGVIAKGQWDLPAMGILKLIFDNKSGIQTLVNAIGKSYWNDIIWNVYCWSSNEYSSINSWSLSLFDGSTSNGSSKLNYYRFVIPVFTVS